jgi:hypothetical protein
MPDDMQRELENSCLKESEEARCGRLWSGEDDFISKAAECGARRTRRSHCHDVYPVTIDTRRCVGLEE